MTQKENPAKAGQDHEAGLMKHVVYWRERFTKWIIGQLKGLILLAVRVRL